MKLVELQPNKYNDLVVSEPGASFYQTANWGDFYSRLGYTPIYLENIDEANVYSAFGLFLIKNAKSIFERKTAIRPFDYLINYYDTKLLKDFTADVKKYLSKKGVGKLNINPNILNTTQRGNNELLIKNICSLNYKKTKANTYYTTQIGEIAKAKALEDISLKTYVIEKQEDENKLFKTNINYKHLYYAMGRLAKFVVCELNVNDSIAKLNESINSAKYFIEIHKEDNKYNAKIENKNRIINEKQNILNLLNKCLRENGENPILAFSCLIEFNNKLTVLFTDSKNEYQILNILQVLNAKTIETISKLGYKPIDSYTANENSKKIDLIGEFTYRI